MGRPVIFKPSEFREAYPQFTEGQFSDAQLRQAFGAAVLMVDNSAEAVIPYDPETGVEDRKILLFMLMCHICTLNLRGREGQAGPVTSASEGSVKVSFAVPAVTGRGADWYQQTPCGQAYWNAVRQYTSGGRYAAGRKFHPWG